MFEKVLESKHKKMLCLGETAREGRKLSSPIFLHQTTENNEELRLTKNFTWSLNGEEPLSRDRES